MAVTERGWLLVSGNNTEGQLGICSRENSWGVTVLGGRGHVEGDEVAVLVGGLHALALADAPGTRWRRTWAPPGPRSTTGCSWCARETTTPSA